MQGHWQEIRADATTPSRLIPALSSGCVVGLLIIVIQLSLASLIFSGPLAAFAPRAAGLTLFGGFVMCLVVALGSSYPASICLPEDSPAAILTTVAAGLAASLATSLATESGAHSVYVTVGAAMALSTLATGVMFLLLGRLRLGNLMRYMPYPVVGGFLAGVGWLLVRGSFSIMAGVPLGFAGLPELLHTEKILRWLPGVALALALLLAMRRWKRAFILPGTLAVAMGGFVLYLLLTGQGLADTGRAGLLLGNMPEGPMLWPVFTFSDIALIRWDALAEQIPQLLTIPLVSSISFLLVCSGMETAAQRDLDLKHELYLNAAVNFLAGPGGSHTGFTALSFSMIGPSTGSDSRLVGISAALLVGLATFFGATTLGYCPRFILGGLVLFLGLSTLLSWAVDARNRVTRVEHGLILSILCAIALFGFLTGVGIGLIMATVVFVIKYSRIPVVRQDTDATDLSSAKLRSVPDQHILRELGHGIRILRVTGYLFFGSANELSRTVSVHLDPDSGPRPAYIILDFTDVDGFDSSAVSCFLRMVQRCAAVGSQLHFSAAPPTLEEQMRRADPVETERVTFFADLDRALEWSEDALLARRLADLETQKAAEEQGKLFDSAVDDLLQSLEESERFETLVERLDPYLEHREVPEGEVVVHQDEVLDGVLLLVYGQAEEVRQTETGARSRLRTFGPGGMAGHIGSARLPAPGTISALTRCRLSFLPGAALRQVETDDPALALAFYSQYAMQLQAQLAQPAHLRL